MSESPLAPIQIRNFKFFAFGLPYVVVALISFAPNPETTHVPPIVIIVTLVVIASIVLVVAAHKLQSNPITAQVFARMKAYCFIWLTFGLVSSGFDAIKPPHQFANAIYAALFWMSLVPAMAIIPPPRLTTQVDESS